MEGARLGFVDDAENKFCVQNRASTLRDVKRLMSDIELKGQEVPSWLLSLYMLLSSPFQKPTRPSVEWDELTLLRLYRACYSAPALLPVVIRLSESSLLKLLQDDVCHPQTQVKALLLRSYIQRLLSKGKTVSSRLMSLFFELCVGGESASHFALGSQGGEEICASFDITPSSRVCVRWRNACTDLAECVWPGAMAMSEAVSRQVIDVSGKRVLELGCGCGMLGVACVAGGNAQSVVMTDCNEEGLALARRNMETLQRENEKSKIRFRAEVLDWSAQQDEWLRSLQDDADCDVVLIADCWYCFVAHLAREQAQCVKYFLERAKLQNRSCCAYVVAGVRGDDAIERFLNAYKDCGLLCESFPLPTLQLLPEQCIFPFYSALPLESYRVVLDP